MVPANNYIKFIKKKININSYNKMLYSYKCDFCVKQNKNLNICQLFVNKQKIYIYTYIFKLKKNIYLKEIY